MSKEAQEVELHALLSAAEKLRPRLERRFLAHPIFLQPEVRLTSRVKSITRAATKLAKITIEKSDATPADVPDLLGLRIIALYNSNLFDALDVVWEAIKNTDKDNPFEHEHLAMAIYSARPETDPLSLRHEVKRWAEGRGIALNTEPPTSTLYSSIHFNAVCPIEVERIGGIKRSGLKVEIQVRTTIEDVWSQLSHESAYARVLATPSILGHLNALKQMLDGCASYMNLIKSEADSTGRALKEGSESPKSAGDQPLKQIKGIPAELITFFDAAIRQRNAAAELEDKLGTEAFLEAARRFASIEEQLRDLATLSTPEKVEAINRTQMERAFCLLFSFTVQGLEEAYTIYESLAKADANDAVCRLRLAQALRRKREISRAKVVLLEAVELLDKNLDHRVDAKNWVRGRVHEELGTNNWLIYESTSDEEGKRGSLLQAISEAGIAVKKYKATSDSESYLIGAINNLLYFVWEECRIYKECSLSRHELEMLVDELSLRKIRALVPAHKWDAFFDTSLRINWYQLERSHESLELATAIIDAIQEKVKRRSGKDFDYSQMQKVLTADEMDTYLHAVDVASRIAKSVPKH